MAAAGEDGGAMAVDAPAGDTNVAPESIVNTATADASSDDQDGVGRANDDGQSSPAVGATTQGNTNNVESDNDDDDDVDAIDPARYHVDQRVFVRERGSLHESVVRRAAIRDSGDSLRLGRGGNNNNNNGRRRGWSYLVHFLGWSARWDRWVDQPDLINDTPEARAEAERGREEEAKEREREKAERDARRREQKRKSKERERKRRRSTGGAEDADGGSGGEGNEGASRKKKKRKRSRSSAKDGDDAEGTTSFDTACAILEDACDLPFTLKTVLMDDRERLTRMGRTVAEGVDGTIAVGAGNGADAPPLPLARVVHALPSKLTVRSVLHRYLQAKRKGLSLSPSSSPPSSGAAAKHPSPPAGTPAAAADHEAAASALEGHRRFVTGLLTLFDGALPVFLLYQEEREQYLGLVRRREGGGGGVGGDTASSEATTIRPCDVYGCEHLLRLYVRLPQLAAASGMAARDAEDMGRRLEDLAIFLQRNRTACFKGRYRVPAADEMTEAERRRFGREGWQLVSR